MPATALSPGQRWSYQTRPGEEHSRIVICRIDSETKLAGIVHIRVIGLRMRNPNTPNGFTDVIGHLPYDVVALRNQLIDPEPTPANIPDDLDGYRQWREAFDDGKASVWTIPIRQAVAAMESILTRAV